MFSPGSRYAKETTYTVQTKRGAVTATTIPLPRRPQLLGFHRRMEGERLDYIATRHLSDPTAFHRLCDVSGTIAPDALAVRDLVGVPVTGT